MSFACFRTLRRHTGGWRPASPRPRPLPADSLASPSRSRQRSCESFSSCRLISRSRRSAASSTSRRTPSRRTPARSTASSAPAHAARPSPARAPQRCSTKPPSSSVDSDHEALDEQERADGEPDAGGNLPLVGSRALGQPCNETPRPVLVEHVHQQRDLREHEHDQVEDEYLTHPAARRGYTCDVRKRREVPDARQVQNRTCEY